jgi:stage V sporulation protein D (sporulation-specific penicillin-binding protein)
MVELSLRPMGEGALSASSRVLSEAGVRTAKTAMEKVITEGTGKKLKEILQYRAFGKSGTAQLTEFGTGRYYDGKWLASFVAGAPYDRPEIVVLVTIEDPDQKAKETGGATGGGAVAGPVAAEIINDVLGYMGVPPDANGELVYADKKDEQKKLVGR